MSESEYELLVDHGIRKGDLQIEYDATPENGFSAEIRASIDQTWQEFLADRKKKGGRTDDGHCPRLLSWCNEDGQVTLRLRPGRYSHYLGARCPVHRRWQLANPLAVCLVAVTADNAIVLERRRHDLLYGGRYHVIGGYVDGRRDLVGGKPNPVFAMARECWEEIGWRPASCDLEATGFVYDAVVPHPELCFAATVPLALEEVVERAAKRREFRAGETESGPLLAEPESISAFLDDNRGWIVPSGAAALLLFGRHRFGEEWFARHRDLAGSSRL